MSDEHLFLPVNSVDMVDECAPTERDPSHLAVATPSRGVALSVLWWLEGEQANDGGGAGRDRDGDRDDADAERARD